MKYTGVGTLGYGLKIRYTIEHMMDYGLKWTRTHDGLRTKAESGLEHMVDYGLKLTRAHDGIGTEAD